MDSIPSAMLAAAIVVTGLLTLFLMSAGVHSLASGTLHTSYKCNVTTGCILINGNKKYKLVEIKDEQ